MLPAIRKLVAHLKAGTATTVERRQARRLVRHVYNQAQPEDPEWVDALMLQLTEWIKHARWRNRPAAEFKEACVELHEKFEAVPLEAYEAAIAGAHKGGTTRRGQPPKQKEAAELLRIAGFVARSASTEPLRKREGRLRRRVSK